MSAATTSAPRSQPLIIAPAPTTNGQHVSDGTEQASTMPYTCETCARRKVRCDKTVPTCSTCRKARLDCNYHEPAPRKRKRKPIDDIQERLDRYEKLLRQHGIDHDGGHAASLATPDETPNPNRMSSKAPAHKSAGSGKLVGDNPGRTRYIDATVWKDLNEDLQSSSDEEEELDPPPVSPYEAYPSARTADPVSAALLSSNSPSASLIDLHPTYESAMKMWKIYVDYVDPVVKVVHVPSTLGVLQRAAANPSSASKATEALLFAIYHFAITAMSETECHKLLAEPRTKLLTRYHDALRQALVNASFMRSTDLTLVQAFILLLLAVRSTYDPHMFWVLTGVAVRVAQRIGLHRDGEELGLKPFDVQLRRRIFWQLLPLDGMAAQMSGTGISMASDAWSVKQMLNLNDTDIWPGMIDVPEPRTGATDVMFCLARTEIAKCIQKAKPPMGNWTLMWQDQEVEETNSFLNGLESEMENKYVRHCDFGDPVHNLTMVMCRASVTSARLRIRLNRDRNMKDVSDEERRTIWALAKKVLDYNIATYNDPGLARFMWHLNAFFQFDSLLWILTELRRDPLSYKDENVWARLDQVYNNHPELMVPKRSLQAAVGRLTLRTWETYQSHLARNGQLPEPEPCFIPSLRAVISKRPGTHPSSGPTPKDEYNPWGPGDASADLSGPDFLSSVQYPSDFDFNQMIDSATDSMDWTFWDQLIQNPSSFPTS
ncbi:hypothetical protein LTR37_009164 [Vermiconidia calcicola]|uniref:Uncharacterized protein n=1 Tax=Vermiconidia calcicola TaxID=1690605 RepID=A0ACC3NAD0_9PEZI|nr:hypothetical protein LTR37_009164 [Vermiconidia calcicola]